MRKMLASVVALFASVLATETLVLAQDVQPPIAPAPRVILKLKSSSPVLTKAAREGVEPEAAVAQALGERIGIALAPGAALADATQVVRAAGITSADLAARLAREPDVAFAVPDRKRRAYLIPNDPLYGEGV